MKRLLCENCGNSELTKTTDGYVCHHCGVVWQAETIDSVYVKLSGILDDYKQEQLANARSNLYKATHEELLDNNEIIRWIGEVKNHYPEDFLAGFYKIAIDSNKKQLNVFLDEMDVDKHRDYMDVVLPFMIKIMEEENLRYVANLIVRAYDQTDPKYVEFHTLYDNCAEEIQKGTYDVLQPRDVFVAYKSEDMPKVNELLDCLDKNGLTYFVATRNLRHGKNAANNYKGELKNAMDSCQVVVFVSSCLSRTTGDARKELKHIRDQDIYMRAPGKYRIYPYTEIPAEFKKSRVEYLIEPYENISKENFVKEFFHGLQWARNPQEVCDRVCEILDRPLPKINDPAEFLAQQMAEQEKQRKAEEAKREQERQKALQEEQARKKQLDEQAKALEEQQQKLEAQKKQFEQDQKALAAERQLLADEKKKNASEEQRKTETARKAKEEAERKEKKEAQQNSQEQRRDPASIYNEAKELYDQKNYKQAVELFRQAAEQGHAKAQNYFGVCYYAEQGVSQNFGNAVYWFTKSAEQGFASAQYNLGMCYEYGEGVSQDHAKAMEWYEKAAANGSEGAKRKMKEESDRKERERIAAEKAAAEESLHGNDEASESECMDVIKNILYGSDKKVEKQPPTQIKEPRESRKNATERYYGDHQRTAEKQTTPKTTRQIKERCSDCGGELLLVDGEKGIAECSCCRAMFFFPEMKCRQDAIIALRQAEHDMEIGDFYMEIGVFYDAYHSYKKAAMLAPNEPEAYFGMALAQFKVQYLKDEVNDKELPICHESDEEKLAIEKFSSNENYIKAITLAAPEQRYIYQKRARDIDYIRDQFAYLKKRGMEYDCFICVKVSSIDGGKTEDYHIATKIYEDLKKKGFKVFFSEREINFGVDYEAQILYALYSSKCMLVVCTDKTYLHTPWFKNEYTRFNSMIEFGQENKARDSIAIIDDGSVGEALPGIRGKIPGINYRKFNALELISAFVSKHSLR